MQIRTSLGWSTLLPTWVALVTVACNRGPDPADANLAPIAQNAPAAPAGQYPPTEQYPSAERYAEVTHQYGSAPVYPPGEDRAYEYVEAPAPPPPLPVYDQPPCPGPDYLWTPGYWDYSNAGYYWVPGAWVMAPYIDALWTPPYWEFYSGRYRRHHGYWARHIGFYGGVNYGYGYTGLGFYGGYWSQGGVFVYNRAAANVDPGIVRSVYSHAVVNATPNNRISYYGGSGGIARAPAPAEVAVRSEARVAPLPAQIEHVRAAAADRALLARENRGRPPVAALTQPLPAASRAPAPPPRSWQFETARQTPPAANLPMRREPPSEAPAPENPRGVLPPTQPVPQMATRGRVENRPVQLPSSPGGTGAPPTAPGPHARQELHPAPAQQVVQAPPRPEPPQRGPAPFAMRHPRQEMHPEPTRQTVQTAPQSQPAPPPVARGPQPRQETRPESPRPVMQAPTERPSPFPMKPVPPPRQEARPAPPQVVQGPPPQQRQEVRPEPPRPMMQAPPQAHPAPPPQPRQEVRPEPPHQTPQTAPPGRGNAPPEKGPPRREGRGGLQ